MSNKFDFRVANSLVQAVEGVAAALDVKSGQLEKRFGNLREGFKDSGYDALMLDMSAANKAIEEVIGQLHAVSKHIADYSIKIQEASK